MPELTLWGGPVDGLRLHYLAAGTGPPVLLIHGLGGFAESWRHNLPALARQAAVVSVDLPGFGHSSKPPGPYHLSRFVEALDGFIGSLELGRTSLIGHSLGGAVAVAYALARPERVERLVLIGAVVPGFDYRASVVCRVLATPNVGELLGWLLGPGMLRFALSRCFAAPDAGEVDFLVQNSARVWGSPEGRAAFLATLRGVGQDFLNEGQRYQEWIRNFDRPVLSIHGRQDPVVSLRHAELVAHALPNATLRVLDRCGHFPQIEHAAIVNRWLGEFIGEIRWSRSPRRG
ncbi:MAG: alpha/beta fold hydrolase [Candidatus Methylomirabilia bacterium]